MTPEMISALAEAFGAILGVTVEPTAEAVVAVLPQIQALLIPTPAPEMVAEGGEEFAMQMADEELLDEEEQKSIKTALGLKPDADAAAVTAHIETLKNALLGGARKASGIVKLANAMNQVNNTRVHQKVYATGGDNDGRTFGINTGKGAKTASIYDIACARLGIASYKHKNARDPEAATKAAVLKAHGLKTVSGQVGGNLGFFTNAEIATDFIEPLYKETILSKLGVSYRSIPAGVRRLEIRKFNGGTTVRWGGESQTTTDSDVQGGFVSLSMRKLIAEVILTQEELRFADASIESRITNDLRMNAAIEMDRSGLRGTGAKLSGHKGEEMLGVRYHPNITKTTLDANGRKIAYADLIAAKTRILTDNVPMSNTWAYTFPYQIEEVLETLTDTTKQPILSPYTDAVARRIRGIAYEPTNQIPTNLTTGTNAATTEVYLGDWKYLEIGMSQDFEVVVDESVLRRSGEVLIQGVMYVDCVVTREEAFEILLGVNAS